MENGASGHPAELARLALDPVPLRLRVEIPSPLPDDWQLAYQQSLGPTIELAREILPRWQQSEVPGRWIQWIRFPPGGALVEEVFHEACLAFLEHCHVAGRQQGCRWRITVLLGPQPGQNVPEEAGFVHWCQPAPDSVQARAQDLLDGPLARQEAWQPQGLAVITGAGSGIGRALASVAAERGMRLWLIDIHASDLRETVEGLGLPPARCGSSVMDVSSRASWELLAQQIGPVELLINNAGVGAGGSPWETTPLDWQWVLGVNFWGALHGLQCLRPARSLQVASSAGYYAYYPGVAYQVSKRALVQLTLGLRARGQRASVLAPGSVKTRILSSGRNRPPDLQQPLTPPPRHVRLLRAALHQGMDPRTVAELAFAGLESGQIEIFTHPELRSWCAERWQDLALGRDPQNTVRLREAE